MSTPAYLQKKNKCISVPKEDFSKISKLLRECNVNLAEIVTDGSPSSNEAYKLLDENLFRIRSILSQQINNPEG